MREQRLRVLTDVDEVLANFQTPALGIMERVLGRTFDPQDFKVWDIFAELSAEELRAVFAELEKPGWCTALEPKPGALEAIRELQTFCDVYVVTSPFPSETWVHERYDWLTQHFGFARNQVVHTNAKHLIVGDVLLDDSPANVDAWNAAHPGKMGLLWHIENTRLLPYDHVRVRSWQEVITRVRDFQAKPSIYDLLHRAEWRKEADATGVSYYCVGCGGVPWTPTHKPDCQVNAILTAVYGADRRAA